MRRALNLIAGSFNLGWGYAPICPLSKTLFYQRLSRSLIKSNKLPLNKVSPVNGTRNFSLRWVSLKGGLTPLASTERKAVSGFDLRLTTMKGPFKIKRNRRGSFPFYLTTFVSNDAQGTKMLASPMPHIGQNQGWGVRSSKSLEYLCKMAPSTFQKQMFYSTLIREGLPIDILISAKTFLAPFQNEDGEGEDTEPCLEEGVGFFISSNLSRGSSSIGQRAYFEKKGENPNLTPVNIFNEFELRDLNLPVRNSLNWLAGFVSCPFFITPLTEVVFYKSYTASKLLIF